MKYVEAEQLNATMMKWIGGMKNDFQRSATEAADIGKGIEEEEKNIFCFFQHFQMGYVAFILSLLMPLPLPHYSDFVFFVASFTFPFQFSHSIFHFVPQSFNTMSGRRMNRNNGSKIRRCLLVHKNKIYKRKTFNFVLVVGVCACIVCMYLCSVPHPHPSRHYSFRLFSFYVTTSEFEPMKTFRFRRFFSCFVLLNQSTETLPKNCTMKCRENRVVCLPVITE